MTSVGFTASAPKVSVIIPAHNAAATILETIRSVQRQTVDDLEIIVVDDGSTDDTLQMVRGVRDDGLTVYGYERAGVAQARNRGLAHASGDLVSFLDADDLWMPEKLALQIRALENAPRAGAAYSWTVFVDDQTRFLFAKEPLFFARDVYSDLLASNFLASGSNVLARRSCLDAIGGFDPSFSPAEDWEYWLRFAARWEFAVVPRYHVLYRYRLGSHSANVQAMERKLNAVVDSAFRAAPQIGRRERNAALANVKQYVSFMHLMRTKSPRALAEAGRALREGLAAHPRSLWNWKFQALLATWLALHLVPRRWVPAVSRQILRGYGRWTRLVTPALRADRGFRGG